MSFAAPHILWLLMVLPPAMVLFFWWSSRKSNRLLREFVHARLLTGLLVGIGPRRRNLRLGLLVAAVICLLVALARPQWGFAWEEARIRGLDIVVAVDTSKSMLCQDIAPNRLTRAKLAALDLARVAKSDRLGLVAFAGGAFLQCPLTIDEAAFRQSVETLDVSTISLGGTVISEAIEAALTAFKEGESYKVLVLFSDGEDHDPNAISAAKKAAEAGLKIFTIGIGTPEGELLRAPSASGNVDYVRDEQGNAVKSRLNEDLLRRVASSTEGGFYLPLRGANTVETLYEEGLAKLPKADRQDKLVKRYHERFHWPLTLAVLLLAMEIVIPTRPPNRKNGANLNIARASGLAVTGLLLLTALPAAGSSAKALRDYRAGNYGQALQGYEELSRKNPKDLRLRYNTGASAYRDGKYEEAVKSFSDALNAEDLKLQESAYYNRGNAQYYLGESSADPAKRKEAWEKSVQDFQSSLKLNPKDQDAQWNQQFVKRRLEELQQQQQQQQQKNEGDQDEQQQQQGDKKQDSPQPQNKDQQSQPQQQPNSEQAQSSDREKQPDSEPSPEDKENQKEQQAKQQQEKKEAAAQKPEDRNEQNSSNSPEQGGEKQEEETAPVPGQMTPEQAKQLLDSQKGDEKMLPSNLQQKGAQSDRPVRDW